MTYLDTATEQKHKRNTNPLWTDENLELLRGLAKNGLSASQIASKMGFATRNAIIGKLHRLGIVSKKVNKFDPYDGKVRHRATGSQIKPVNVNPQKVHAHYTRKHRLRLEFPDTSPKPPTYIAATAYDEAIPQEQRLTLLQLNGHTCRWPVGSPTESDFFFCGAFTNSVYCPHHTTRSVRTW